MAFPPGSGASLLIKTLNAGLLPEQARRLQQAADSHPDVYVLDAYLPVEHMHQLQAVCDCCVSLHRAEGFGLPLAEAMYLGKPVIATAYGGNLDFMDESVAHLVPAISTPVRDSGPMFIDGEWAQPDVASAARYMRAVFERPDEAAALGRRGAAAIRESHSPEQVGARIEERLRLVSPRRRWARRRCRLLHRRSAPSVDNSAIPGPAQA
jgi:glycosyltransferase involved in cell wall biosynthesis